MSSRLTSFNVDRIRQDFPILSEMVYGKPLVYFDNAASAQKPRVVIDTMVRTMETGYANVHRGLHYMANRATEALEEARETVREFINAPSVSEIIFTKSATEAYNLVAQSMGNLSIGEEDEIILSVLEHHSNIVPWHFLRERKGAVLRWAGLDNDGNFSLAHYKSLFSKKTKMVSITHMSNVLGTVTPVEEIIRIAHEFGVPVLIDGAQAAVHRPVDVQRLDADFYVMTGHKLYGPTGIGTLFGKKEWLEKLPPFLGGGEMVDQVTQDKVTYNSPPYRFEAGTPPIIEGIALGAALKYMKSIGTDLIQGHEKNLLTYAEERLREVKTVKIYGKPKEKGAIIAFSMEGAHPHDVSSILDHYGVAIRAGTHCAMPLLEHYGVRATCRASFGVYNTHSEIDVFIDALLKAEQMFS